jgi:hypothetical protein
LIAIQRCAVLNGRRGQRILAVLISTDVTLSGGKNDVWIFQIAGTLTQANAAKMILKGGARSKNIFWQASGTVVIGTTAHPEGGIGK